MAGTAGITNPNIKSTLVPIYNDFIKTSFRKRYIFKDRKGFLRNHTIYLYLFDAIYISFIHGNDEVDSVGAMTPTAVALYSDPFPLTVRAPRKTGQAGVMMHTSPIWQ